MKINALRKSIAALTVLFMSTPIWAQAPQISWDLDEAISQIDRQAGDFSTFMARAEVINKDADGTEDTTIGTGFIREDGMMRYDPDDSDTQFLVDRNKVMVHNKAEKTVNEYRFRDHKDRLEPFIRLGFSNTGKDLRDNYLITILGEEQIGDARTLQLELTPKKDNVRQTVRTVTLWIDQASWMPKRQLINATDGSTMTITYSGIARNIKLRSELFSDRWPRGTEVIRN